MGRSVAHRQKLVEAAFIRGFSEVEIANALRDQGVLNPKTEKPYTSVTVHRDIVKIRKIWREELNRSRDDRIAEILPRLQALQKAGWTEKNYDLVRKTIKDIRDLMGLDAPKKAELKITNAEVVNAILDVLPGDYADRVREALSQLGDS